MKSKPIITALITAMLISACGSSATSEPTPDVAAVRTSAASTVVSLFTLTAAAFTVTPSQPTDTSVPEQPTATDTEAVVGAQATNTAGTPVPCDSLTYDLATVDVNVHDGTHMAPGQEFIKTWKVKNNGPCPWGAGYALTYAGYTNQMSGQFIAFTEVIQTGQEVEVSVQFKAPDQAGEYLSAWTMKNAAGVTFPEIIFVKILVP